MKTMSLVNLVQLICLEKQSAALILMKEDEEDGVIFFNQGEIIDAAAGPIHGEEAVLEILTWNEGKFRLSSDVLLPRRTITTPWEEILAEGRRRVAEMQVEGAAILKRDENLTQSEIEHDNALELDLIYLLSKLEHSRASLTESAGQDQVSEAFRIFSRIMKNVVEMAGKHLPGNVLDEALSAAYTADSGMDLLKVKNDLMSVEMPGNDQKWQAGGGDLQAAYPRIGLGIVEILDRFFALLTKRFRSVSAADRWSDTCDAFLDELRSAIEGYPSRFLRRGSGS
ncbi:MAG: DUF4388 domain-containing protein [Anaerolineales bacterium]